MLICVTEVGVSRSAEGTSSNAADIQLFHKHPGILEIEIRMEVFDQSNFINKLLSVARFGAKIVFQLQYKPSLMKESIGRLKKQVKSILNMDVVTKDRPVKFQLVTIVLLSMAISCTMICVIKTIQHP